MLLNNSHGVILDFGSMTPASITVTTRSEAQRWQVMSENKFVIIFIYFLLLGLGRRKLLCAM
jgi:hypothetical protein